MTPWIARPQGDGSVYGRDVQASETLTAPEPPYTRVAVAQLDFVPAIPAYLENPFRESGLASAGDLPLERLKTTVPALVGDIKELGFRLRDAYVRNLQQRLEAIVQAALIWEAQVLLLPEYSVPPELLVPLTRLAPEIVIVAGTHLVDETSLRAFKQLGCPSLPKLGQAVAPVLHQGTLLGFQAKLSSARPELGRLVTGEAWAPLPLPHSIPGPLGVLICIDYLSRGVDATSFTRLAECRWLAVPAFSSEQSVGEFASALKTDAARRKLPALFANHAAYGGSRISIDDDAAPASHSDPLHSNEEGLIVADINLGLERPGPHTSFQLLAGMKPISKSSLVYESAEGDYARWAKDMDSLLGNKQEDELAAIDALRVHLSRLPTAPAAPRSRNARLAWLSSNVGQVSLEECSVAAREVFVPDVVPPPGPFLSRLAQAAADVVRRWRARAEHEVARHLDLVIHQLEKDAAASAISLSLPANRALDAATSAVRGRDYLRAAAILDQRVVTQNVLLAGDLQEEKSAAERLFQAGEYELAVGMYERILEKFGAYLDDESMVTDENVHHLRYSLLLNQVAGNINLGRTGPARVLIDQIDVHELNPRLRIHAAELLAALGDHDEASQVLPSELEASEDNQRLVEAQQMLAIYREEMPLVLTETARVRLSAAALLTSKGRFSQALEICWAASEQSLSDVERLTLASAMTEVLRQELFAISASEYDLTPEQRVKLAQYSHDCLENLGETLNGRQQAAQVMYYASTLSALTLDRVCIKSTAGGHGQSDELIERLARMAATGQCEQALAMIPEDSHPWRARALEVNLLLVAKRSKEAVERVKPLYEAFANRIPLLLLASDAYREAGLFNDALHFAEAAFRKMPTLGIRLLKARLMFTNGKVEEVQSLLSLPNYENEPEVLRVLAACADSTNFVRAATLWELYLAKAPNDAAAQMRYAQALNMLGRSAKAADVAWKAAECSGDRFTAEALLFCRAMQQFAVLPREEREARTRHIEALLTAHHPDEPAVQWVAFQKRLEGTGTSDDTSVNYDLLEREGYLKRLTLEELQHSLEQRATFAAQVNAFYRSGGIPLYTLCQQLGVSPATIILEWLSDDSSGHVCGPLLRDSTESALDTLYGKSLLLAHPELVLLAELKLFEPLKKAVGSGELLITRSTLQAVVKELLDHVETDKPLNEADLEVLELLSIVSVGDARTVSEEQLLATAAYRGLVTSEEATSVASQLGCKFQSGVLDDDTGGGVRIPVHLMQSLAHLGKLQLVRSLYEGRLVKSEQDVRAIQNEQAMRARNKAAAALVRTIHAEVLKAQAEQRLKVVEDPRLPDVGATTLPDSRIQDSLLLRPLREHMAKIRLLEDNPTWCWLSTDFFGTLSLGLPQLVRELKWTSPSAYFDQLNRSRKQQWRIFGIASLVRLLKLSPLETTSRLERLARMGAGDALSETDVTALIARYRTFTNPHLARVLDGFEWVARDGNHVGCDSAQVHLANTYGRAILELPSEMSVSPAAAPTSASAVPQWTALLDRVDEIGRVTERNTLQSCIFFLASYCLGQPKRLGREAQGGWEFLEDSPGSALWATIYAWAGDSQRRRAAIDRGIVDTWAALGRWSTEGPESVQCAVLLQAHLAGQRSTPGVLSLARGPHEALAILSANWDFRPLDLVRAVAGPNEEFKETHEQLLVIGAKELESGRGLLRARRVRFEWSPDDHGRVLVEAPVEALVLRASSEYLRNNAESLARLQGQHDGKLGELLGNLAQSPEATELRLEYAERAAQGLWRLVRDDPEYICEWVRSIYENDGNNLSALKLILSEPDYPLRQELAEVGEGNATPPLELSGLLGWRGTHGFWRARPDKANLYHAACRFPGTLPLSAANAIFFGNQRDEFALAWTRELSEWRSQPAEELAVRIPFLRAVAEVSPVIQEQDEKVDVRAVLSRWYEDVLCTPVEPGSTADEPAFLRFALRAVRFSLLAATAEIVDVLWLTYRLCHWLRMQLSTLPADAHRKAVERLAELAPADKSDEAQDLLDPRQFSPDALAYRTIVLLQSITSAEAWARQLRTDGSSAEATDVDTSQSPEQTRWSPLSAKAISELTALADRSMPSLRCETKVFEGKIPHQVADLAALILVQNNSENFAGLSPAAQTRLLQKSFDILSREPGEGTEFAGMVLYNILVNLEALTRDQQEAFVAQVPRLAAAHVTLRALASVLAFNLGYPEVLPLAVEAVGAAASDAYWQRHMSMFFSAVVEKAPSSLVETAEEFVRAAISKKVDPFPVLLALKAASSEGDLESPVEHAILQLARLAVFTEDVRIRELLQGRPA